MPSVGTFFIGKSNIARKIDKIVIESKSDEELATRLSRFNISILEFARDLPRMDCQDWAFQEIGLPQYGFKRYRSVQEQLYLGEIPELRQTRAPSDGALVAYAFKGIEDCIELPAKPYQHYGIVRMINDVPFVDSKWGGHKSGQKKKAHVYRHPLMGIDYFGNYVDFYVNLKRKK